MAKYKELSKKDKKAFWVGLIFSIVWLAAAIWVLYRFGLHLYHREWTEAELMVAVNFACFFWARNRRNKKKVAELKDELMMLKITRQRDLSDMHKKAFQAGIDFQRSMLAEWIGQRIARNG